MKARGKHCGQFEFSVQELSQRCSPIISEIASGKVVGCLPNNNSYAKAPKLNTSTGVSQVKPMFAWKNSGANAASQQPRMSGSFNVGTNGETAAYRKELTAMDLPSLEM